MEGGEWSNFNAAVCVNEEADFMAQLFPNPNDVNLNYSHHHHHYHIIANNTNTNTNNNNNNNVEGGSSYYSSDSTSNSQNMYRYSQESSYNRNSHDHEVHYQNYFGDHHHHQQLAAAAASNASSLPIDFLQCHMEDHENGAINNDADVDNEDHSELDPSAQDKICNSSYNSKKRSRVLEIVQKGKRIVRVKRSQSLSALGGDDDEKENDGIAVNRQSSSSGSLEDDCSSKGTTTTTTTTTTTILNSNGKTRASRGSATDPQSLYARKRRERINERLKILQSLVPNGTKVDISTMLEEAVQYVKFLQLQIKLLSSDEHWMYAPIAYNGMNIGLDFQFK